MAAMGSTKWSQIREPRTPERQAGVDLLETDTKANAERVTWTDRFVGIAAIAFVVITLLAAYWGAVALGLLPLPSSYWP